MKHCNHHWKAVATFSKVRMCSGQRAKIRPAQHQDFSECQQAEPTSGLNFTEKHFGFQI
jgi:hypothetical protein